MRVVSSLVLVACITLNATAQHREESQQSDLRRVDHRSADSRDIDEAQLRGSVTGFMKAYNSNDADALAAFYAEDASYVSPHVPDLMIRGRDRIRENWQRGMAMGGHIDTVEVLSVGMSGDLAYIVSRYEATNAGVKAHGRNVLVLSRINGTWLIETHASVVKD